MSASSNYRQIAFDYFEGLATAGGASWQRAGWSGHETQLRRWEVFARALPFGGQSVLDVGAGAGGFASFLERIGAAPARYIGVELVSKNCYLLAAEPGVEAAICGTIDAIVEMPCVDYVAASGLFNFPHPAWVDHFVYETEAFLLRARRAVVVNAIVDDSQWSAAIDRLAHRGIKGVEHPSGDERERAIVLSRACEATS